MRIEEQGNRNFFGPPRSSDLNLEHLTMTTKNTTTTKTPAAKPTKKAIKVAVKASKNGKAADGSLRGVAKPKNWKPEVKKLSFQEIKDQTKEQTGGAASSGLRAPQARILTLLSKARAPMNRAMIAEETGIDRSWVGDWIGYADAAKRLEQEKKWGHTTLITLGFVKMKELKVPDASPEVVYEITPAGKKELEAYNKLLAWKESDKKAAETRKAEREKAKADKAKAAAKAPAKK